MLHAVIKRPVETSLSSAILQKLTFAQLLKNFFLYWIRSFYYRNYKIPQLKAILGHLMQH
jgi:hypothetical protein